MNMPRNPLVLILCLPVLGLLYLFAPRGDEKKQELPKGPGQDKEPQK